MGEVVLDDGLSAAGGASSIGPFTTFDPHLVLLSFLLGYLLLYVSLVVFDSIAAYLQADIRTNENEGSVDGETDGDIGTSMAFVGPFESPLFPDAAVVSDGIAGIYQDLAVILGIAFFISWALYQVGSSLGPIVTSSDRRFETYRHVDGRLNDP